ncbi:Hypothetical predicted protein [Olea europaea subsp. europaea]|uniref:Uncharacterized protein n=1 Tax=Olea europaea subsp. europaea TaxID=158383 RepID=A0A8S0UKN8_OLEEU|nr:Hypothetical predicted protein [Olea europaea subsp. europaea]
MGKCSMNVCVLPEFVATSPSQEHSIYGDMDDPSMGSLNKVLEIGNGLLATTATEFNGGELYDEAQKGQLGFSALSERNDLTVTAAIDASDMVSTNLVRQSTIDCEWEGVAWFSLTMVGVHGWQSNELSDR